ncbi:hypothetical protein GALMADRAFT_149207 [Galerina marginata CBS 339.88]|uniref:Uncharacterized protein n=1 Tax=Galerina marginata (strain CBS 339.88) TaxID=685588 RepID=A0A067SAR1_GALM3|nr:hypothetical protein GALMADRAFT_149207 [Galerina marginata CBS 339.88]
MSRLSLVLCLETRVVRFGRHSNLLARVIRDLPRPPHPPPPPHSLLVGYHPEATTFPRHDIPSPHRAPPATSSTEAATSPPPSFFGCFETATSTTSRPLRRHFEATPEPVSSRRAATAVSNARHVEARPALPLRPQQLANIPSPATAAPKPPGRPHLDSSAVGFERACQLCLPPPWRHDSQADHILAVQATPRPSPWGLNCPHHNSPHLSSPRLAPSFVTSRRVSSCCLGSPLSSPPILPAAPIRSDLTPPDNLQPPDHALVFVLPPNSLARVDGGAGGRVPSFVASLPPLCMLPTWRSDLAWDFAHLTSPYLAELLMSCLHHLTPHTPHRTKPCPTHASNRSRVAARGHTSSRRCHAPSPPFSTRRPCHPTSPPPSHVILMPH